MNELTQRGIQAIKSGDRQTARQLLGEAIQNDKQDILAWLWLSGAVDTDSERAMCLKEVLRIDPGNQHAARGLALISAQQEKASTPVPIPTEEVKHADTADLVAENIDISPAPPVESDQVSPAVIVTEERPLPVLGVKPGPKRGKQAISDLERGKLIFRTRPSLILALFLFWAFLFGSIGISNLLSDMGNFAILFATGLGLILELIVLFAIIRIMRTRYELTDQQLIVPFRGKKVGIPITDIFHAECRQSTLQKIFGNGDIHVNAVIENELAVVRLRDISGCKQRVRQLHELIQLDQ